MTSLINLKMDKLEETEIRAFDAQLYLSGNHELIRFTYETGVGEGNSRGVRDGGGGWLLILNSW
ncbi:MAG: CRISPR-associated endoribonuclease Cas6 [Promethearchaeota archaeon]